MSKKKPTEPSKDGAEKKVNSRVDYQLELTDIPDIAAAWEESHSIRSLVINGKSPVLDQMAELKRNALADYKKIMSKNIRAHTGALPDELEELLGATRPVNEVLADLTRKPLDLDRDPEFVANRLKADIVEALLRAMQKRGLNQNELAEKLKVTKQWVSRILNESDNFTVATLAKLACAVGMRPFINFADEGEVVRVSSCHSGPVKVEDLASGDDWEPMAGVRETVLKYEKCRSQAKRAQTRKRPGAKPEVLEQTAGPSKKKPGKRSNPSR